MRIAIAKALLLTVPTVLHAQGASHQSMFGTFSNLRYIEESGDVLGYELTIVPDYAHSYAIFQCAEGAPSPPFLVPIKVEGSKFSFTIQKTDYCDGVYTAQITASGLELNGPRWEKTEHLQRKASYWSKR